MAYPYSTERSGFTAPPGKGGEGTPYHIDLKLLQNLPILEKVKKFDALAKQYQAHGRDIEFSNAAVSGRRYSPNAEISEKIDLLNTVAAAHGHSKHSGWDSFDYYVPFKKQSRFDKGAVEGASIYLPTVAGGKVRRGSGGGYGYYSESLDPSGRVVARVGHGDVDRPEAGDINVLGEAPPAPNLPPASPQQVKGDTYIVIGGKSKQKESNDFLNEYVQSLMSRSPQIQSGIDPVGMLTAAFNQTPNYLG